MRAPFQGAEIVTVKAALPAIKRLSADPKVTAGPRRIPAVEEIEQHPLKPRLRGQTQLLPEARQLAGLGNLNPPDYSHPDTLPSVTNHSERAQAGLSGRMTCHRMTWMRAPTFSFFHDLSAV